VEMGGLLWLGFGCWVSSGVCCAGMFFLGRFAVCDMFSWVEKVSCERGWCSSDGECFVRC